MTLLYKGWYETIVKLFYSTTKRLFDDVPQAENASLKADLEDEVTNHLIRHCTGFFQSLWYRFFWKNFSFEILIPTLQWFFWQYLSWMELILQQLIHQQRVLIKRDISYYRGTALFQRVNFNYKRQPAP